MKPRKRWSWFFGGEPSKPIKKKRRTIGNGLNGNGLNGHSDDRFANRIHSRRGVDEARSVRASSTNAYRSEEAFENLRTSKRLKLEGEHDFHVVNDSTGGTMVLKACRMRGFSEFLPIESGSENGASSTPKWLILEHPDGRLSYIHSHRVWYIEESIKTTA